MLAGEWTSLELEFDDWATGAHHAANITSECCAKCQGRGVVGIEPFTPVCPRCEGRGIVNRVAA